MNALLGIVILVSSRLSHRRHKNVIVKHGGLMISIILAAGSGQRMRPLSYYIPKVLLPVKGKPVLDYLMENMKEINVETHYIVASDHLETIEKYVSNTDLENVKVVRALGWETGGDLSLAMEQIDISDDALVMNGDIVTDLNFKHIAESHRKNDGLLTMGVFALKDTDSAKRFGQIILDGNNRIVSFNEKNQDVSANEILVNTGFYFFDRELILKRSSYMVPRKFKLENELFPRLSRENALYASVSKINYWWDVGTMESYLRTEDFMINGGGIVPP